MKSQLVETHTAERVYPYMGKTRIEGWLQVVVFTSYQTGTVVYDEKYPGQIGFYSTEWEEGNFTPLAPGSQVILTQ